MPKLKESPADKARRTLNGNIGFYIYYNNLDEETLLKAVKLSPSTFQRRRKDVGNFTVNELIRLAAAFNVPIGALFEQR